jgi:hypothetical protein
MKNRTLKLLEENVDNLYEFKIGKELVIFVLFYFLLVHIL